MGKHSHPIWHHTRADGISYPEKKCKIYATVREGGNFDHNFHMVTEITEIAREKNCTSAQLALAWLLAQGEDIIPIPGTKHRERLEENLRAVEIELSTADIIRIDKAAPRGFAAGSRYPEAAMRMVNRQICQGAVWADAERPCQQRVCL